MCVGDLRITAGANSTTMKERVVLHIASIDVTSAIEPRFHASHVGVLCRVAYFLWEGHYTTTSLGVERVLVVLTGFVSE